MEFVSAIDSLHQDSGDLRYAYAWHLCYSQDDSADSSE